MDIDISVVTEKDKTALANLMKMYCYEWSQYNLFDVDDDGVYPFERCIHTYFEKPRRWCYLVRVDGKLAGFAFIDDDFALSTPSDFSMSEFFVMHKYRRFGVGRRLAAALFDAHRGKWEVAFQPKNVTSAKFWQKVVGDYTGGDYSVTAECPGLHYYDGSCGTVLTFDNGEKGE